MQAFSPVFLVAILVIAVMLHEVAHGYVADLLGDPTARLAGRLTLNPLRHLDPFGSFFLPLLLWLLHTGFIFGWAKPVPYNPYNLRGGRWGPAYVALAGPGTNLLLALIFGFVLRFGLVAGAGVALLQLVVLINVSLALFNLIPIPPLDGSKVLLALWPARSSAALENWLARYHWFLIIFVLFLISSTTFLETMIYGTFRLLVGQ